MIITAGIDVGSTYTKCVLLDAQNNILAHAMKSTGFRLKEVSQAVFDECLTAADICQGDCDYVVATGIGRHRVEFKDVAATDLTSAAQGAHYYFPGTRTVLDIGGQTMKASRTDEKGSVIAFRLNDKCAAGTGAFLEKTARYMNFTTEEIGPLMETSREAVPISGVCAVFAESEVINHLSLGTPPADVMQGAVESLTTRSVQLMKRTKAQPEYTLVGGILRFQTMARTVEEQLGHEVNVPPGEMCQFVAALGAAILGHRRLKKIGAPQRSRAVNS